MKLAIFVIGMGGGSSGAELLRAFHCDPEMPTASALNQRRDQLSHNIFEYIFQQFDEACPRKIHGAEWRVIGCDGTDLNLPYDPKDAKTYTQSVPGEKSFNQLHLSALCDLGDGHFLDDVIQPLHEENECAAMNIMVDRYDGPHKTIFVADRGYESYSLMAHVIEHGMYFLIRGRDSTRSCIVSGLPSVPPTGNCDWSGC